MCSRIGSAQSRFLDQHETFLWWAFPPPDWQILFHHLFMLCCICAIFICEHTFLTLSSLGHVYFELCHKVLKFKWEEQFLSERANKFPNVVECIWDRSCLINTRYLFKKLLGLFCLVSILHNQSSQPHCFALWYYILITSQITGTTIFFKCI